MYIKEIRDLSKNFAIKFVHIKSSASGAAECLATEGAGSQNLCPDL